MKIKKILIANRGEIAVRIIRAAHELGIKTVSIYSPADKNSLHVKLSDESVCIGGNSTTDSYLNKSSIIMAALNHNVNAIHPGYGFLSEDYLFAQEVINSGIMFIGPTPNQIKLMGNKINAKEIVKSVGVSTIPSKKINLNDKININNITNKIGFPLLIKAALGGGGKGIRKVLNCKDLYESINLIKKEAKANFGSSEIYVEKYLTNARHIEVQVFGDNNGIHILGDRDCSLQINKQKIIEEAPAEIINKDQREKLYYLSYKIANHINYKSLGTLEFLYSNNKFYFLEMNTRIQVEHPVTELTSNIDIVKLQIENFIKTIINLPKNIYPNGNSIEVRLNSEIPFQNFSPSIGKIKKIFFPSGGNNYRIDEGVDEGSYISPYYDSLLAKIIVKGNSRKEAINKLKEILNEISIIGIKTNISFLKNIITSTEFNNNSYNIHFLDENKENFIDED